MGSNLAKRLLVAAIGIPIVVVVAWLGGVFMAIGLGMLAAVGVMEACRMLIGRGAPFLARLAPAVAAAIPAVAWTTGADGVALGLTGALLLMTAVSTMRISPLVGPFRATALSFTATVYVGGLLAFAILLRERLVDDRALGFALFLLPVVVTWLSDTAAYFGGRVLGRRPLAPIVSPNKTVEGGIAGLLAGPVGALVVAHVAAPELVVAGNGPIAAAGLVIAAAAILGDLSESALKRECGAKDSSSLLPGHGGLLDRMDSLLWAFPAAYVCLSWMLG
jgi:phosphatidate cytidylyltransferase